MMKFLDSGRTSFGLTSEMVKKCMPECRVCVTAAQMHRTSHTSPRAKEVCEYLPGECFQLDDDDYGIRDAFSNAIYARLFVDANSGFIVPMSLGYCRDTGAQAL